MTLTKPQMGLILASVVTLYFSWSALKSEDSAEIALPTRTLAATSLPSQISAEKVDFSLQTSTQKRALVPLTDDLFASPKPEKPVLKSPARAAKMLAPPPPIAPPLPFTYLGRWQDDDKNTVMIDYQGEVIAIKTGDIVANIYKVVDIKESANSVQVQFLMMPLNQLQTMQARAGQP